MRSKMLPPTRIALENYEVRSSFNINCCRSIKTMSILLAHFLITKSRLNTLPTSKSRSHLFTMLHAIFLLSFLSFLSFSFSLPPPKSILPDLPVFSSISLPPISSLSTSIRQRRVTVRTYPQCIRFCDLYYKAYPETCYEICSKHFSSDEGASDETTKPREPTTTIPTTTTARRGFSTKRRKRFSTKRRKRFSTKRRKRFSTKRRRRSFTTRRRRSTAAPKRRSFTKRTRTFSTRSRGGTSATTDISTIKTPRRSGRGRFTPSCPSVPIPAYIGSCLTSEELKLYNLINQYRAGNGLPALPLSKTLSTVAQLHAVDSDINYSNPEGSCNLHSWSNSCPGGWDGMCYTGDHNNARFMWSKPNEINSGFQGNGYEISAWYSAGHTAEMAIDGWKKSSGHNALLIEDGWGPFGGIGIGLYGNYAHVWFANESDPDGIGKC